MLKTGIFLVPTAPVQEIVEAARLAESLGFDYAFIPDWGPTRDIYVTLTAVAAATSRLNIGPGITNPYTRHPAASAISIATLDEYSNGRSFLGLGIGGEEAVLRHFGYRISKPLSTSREAITVIRKTLSRESECHEGPRFRMEDIGLKFGRPDIPIYWGAHGYKMLELGGELTDGLIITGTAKFDLPKTRNTFIKGAEKSGRNPIFFYATHIVSDPARIEAARAEHVFSLTHSPSEVLEKLGISAKQIEAARKDLSEHGTAGAAHHVTDGFLRSFIIIGDRDESSAEIAKIMKENQFQVFVLFPPAYKDLARMLPEIRSIIDQACRNTG